MSIPSREELKQEWKRHIERRAEHIDLIIKNVGIALEGCLPDIVDVASRASALIGSYRATITSAQEFGDITEDEYTKFLAQSYRKDEKLAELTGAFKLKCKCQLK